MAGFSNPTNNPLKDKDGRFRTYSLFVEKATESHEPIWTLKDQDITVGDVVYPSLKKIYFSYDHIPGYEYDFAVENLTSWEYWAKLTTSGLRSVFQEWRDELEIRIKARSIKTLINTTKEGGAAGANAAKYLAEKGYAPKRGRPSKDEITRERIIASGVEKEVQDDIERMNLRVVSK